MPLIEIDIEQSEINKRMERLVKAISFQKPDRVPVLVDLGTGYMLKQLGLDFKKFFSDPEAMLEGQLLAAKWKLENLKTDMFWVAAVASFENTREASALGCEVNFFDDAIPWVKGPWVNDWDDLDKLEKLDHFTHGLHGKQLEFRDAMKEVARKYPVRFKGGKEFYPGENTVTSHGFTDGPFTLAAEIRGQTELLEDVIVRPDFVKRLLDIITTKIVDTLKQVYSSKARLPLMGVFYADDFAVNLSPKHFEEFVVPCLNRIEDVIKGVRLYHMCGNITHLLPSITEHMKPNFFHGLGYELDKSEVVKYLSGKYVLMGNVSTINIHGGTPESVMEEARECLEYFAPHKGYILSDGFNIPAGAPLENINAMMEASERWGKYE